MLMHVARAFMRSMGQPYSSGDIGKSLLTEAQVLMMTPLPTGTLPRPCAPSPCGPSAVCTARVTPEPLRQAGIARSLVQRFGVI